MTKTILCRSINEGYQKLIQEMQSGSQISEGRQQGKIHELRDIELVLEDPRKSVLSLPMRNMSRKYAAGEFILYMKGVNSLEDFKFYSKTWEKLATPLGRVNSAYGHRWFQERYTPVDPNEDKHITRFGFALEQLVQNPDTKNAIIMLRDDNDILPDLKDRCCTLALCFNIRDNKLNLRTIMRSQDLWTGLPYDVFCFTRLMQIMLYQYNKQKPEGTPEVSLGTYTHQVLNLHVYEKHWERVKEYTPIPLNTREAYQFPEFTEQSDMNLFPLFAWEDNYRTNTEESLESKAYNLRELKLDPFCETLGSYLVNTITNNIPTEHDIACFEKAQRISRNSKCIDRQVGCVITTKDGDIIGQGCNTVINCNRNCHDKLHRICNVRHGEVSAIESVPDGLKALMNTAYVTLYPCFPCMQAIEKTSICCVKVKGFSHKGSTGTVMLFDPEFFPEKEFTGL